MQLIGQIIGIFAFLITGFAFLQHDEIKLKKILTGASFVWIAHFVFLQAYTGAAVVAAIAIRQAVSTYYHHATDDFRKKLAYLFCFVNVIVSTLTWQNWISIFPFFSATLATISMFLWTGRKMRKGMLTVEGSWFIHNLYFLSWGGLAANLVNSSILTYRIWNNRNKADFEEPITEIEKAQEETAM